MDELSNWLAPQTVNLPPSGLVGSNPTSSTSTYRLMVRTIDFQSINTGSIPVRCTSNSGIVGEMRQTVNLFLRVSRFDSYLLYQALMLL